VSFPRYPKYKESGVEWLGEVPEHWDILPAKHRIISSAGGTSIKGQCADEPSDGLYPGFSASGQDIWLEQPDFNKPGIVLSAVGARCGKAFKADGSWGVVANTHCLFPNAGSDRNFLWYVTNQESWWEKGGTAQPFVKVSETLARKWSFPSLSEQVAIAAFLDRETAKIDALVAEQRRLIELLKEKRQAVISHAVTKGLNPHAPMKPSGIDWLGDVPEHWEVHRVKSVSTFITSGPRGWSERIGDDGSLFIQSGDLNEFLAVDFVHAKRVQVEVDAESARTRICDGDVVVCVTGAKTGNVAVCHSVPEPAYVNQHLCLIRPSERIRPLFLGMLLKSEIGQTYFALSQYGLKQGLSLQDVKEGPVPLPTREEQDAVIERLNVETAKLDALTAEAERAIELLQERRTALISAAVTGKIDVRGLAETEAA
jgi:type I restriction enzyme, S subunit